MRSTRGRVLAMGNGLSENISRRSGSVEPNGRYAPRRSTLSSVDCSGEGEVLMATRRLRVPSNFIEKYLGKSWRTKVVLLARDSPVRFAPFPPPAFSSQPCPRLHHRASRSPCPGLEQNIAFSSSCKQNPFLPLEHSLEIDSTYIGLPTALQPPGLRFLSLPSARFSSSVHRLRFSFVAPSRSRFPQLRRAAPTACRSGALCSAILFRLPSTAETTSAITEPKSIVQIAAPRNSLRQIFLFSLE